MDAPFGDVAPPSKEVENIIDSTEKNFSAWTISSVVGDDLLTNSDSVGLSDVNPRGLDELTSSSSRDENAKQNLNLSFLHKKDEKSKDSDINSESGDSNCDIDADDSLAKSALFMQKKKTSPKEKKNSSSSSTPTTESGIVLFSCCLLGMNVNIESCCSQFLR